MRVEVLALLSWILTAALGGTLATTWIARGGLARQPRNPRRAMALPPPYFPAPLVVGHVAVAAAGLVLWTVYALVQDATGFGIAAVALLLPVVLLGFSMFGRWIGSRRARLAAAYAASDAAPAESRLPTAVVALHGLTGVVTLVLTLTSLAGSATR